MKYCHNNSCFDRELCQHSNPELEQSPDNIFLGTGFFAKDCMDFKPDIEIDPEVLHGLMAVK